jgi:hypothetical protein
MGRRDWPVASAQHREIIMNHLLFLLPTLFIATVANGGAPALRVVKARSAAASLALNGGFEAGQGAAASSWNAYQQGYQIAAGEGRQGSRAVVCEMRDGQRGAGASQTLMLNRTNAAPLVVRGWSKAQDVTGGPDNNYSLYVDLVYADGTQLWGQTANFRCGTDWEPLSASSCRKSSR